MKTFKSNREVTATPMTGGDYNKYRGWYSPGDNDNDDEGYLIEYLDGENPNHKDHAGYITWQTKEQFDNGYTELVNQDKVEFSHIQTMIDSLTFQFARIGGTTTTVCEAFLPNGFSVGSGKSACVDPANFDYELGCKYAQENALSDAKETLWQLEGYLLKITGKTSNFS